VLGTTPVIERYPLFVPTVGPYYTVLVPLWFLQCIAICGPAIAFLGTALPTILDAAPGERRRSTRSTRRAPSPDRSSPRGSSCPRSVSAHLVARRRSPRGRRLPRLQGWERSLTWLAVPALAVALLLRPNLEQRAHARIPPHRQRPRVGARRHARRYARRRPDSRPAHARDRRLRAAGEARQAHYMAWMGRPPDDASRATPSERS
jgi:hypothetical protein